ncbi:MAG: hypothetical protein KBF47_00840 [Gemmatimonadales bacterium]|nr:hypothetical protein [Gemmatimonadales bacterium]
MSPTPFAATALLLTLLGCAEPPARPAEAPRSNAPATPAPPSAGAPPGPATADAPAPVGRPTFINRVWQVADSTGTASGDIYAFLGEGTLVVASARGKPALGRWSGTTDSLTLVEQGVSHPVEVLGLTHTTFRMRSHHPGGTVDLLLVPAPGRASAPN